jgi:hypothetical protein
VETNRKTYTFACVVTGENLMGEDARDLLETVLEKAGML